MDANPPRSGPHGLARRLVLAAGLMLVGGACAPPGELSYRATRAAASAAPPAVTPVASPAPTPTAARGR